VSAAAPEIAPAPGARRGQCARRVLLGACGGLLLWLAQGALATGPSPAELLSKADAIKLADRAEFIRLVKALDGRSAELSSAQREYLDYLHGWNSVYDGDYGTAIKALERLQDSAQDPTLRFRSGATVVNALSLNKHYEEAYSRLNALLGVLPQVTNGQARQQGLLIMTFLYNEVGQYDLGLRFAQYIIDENWGDKGVCRGGQVKLQALYRSRKLQQVGPELQAGMDACVQVGEVSFENVMAVDAAKLYVATHQYDAAIALLKQHYADVVKSGYRRLISEYDAVLAQAYRGNSASPLARKLALDAIENTMKNQFTESLADAYAVLYELAKEQGDFKSALAFHEQFAVADQGYMDDARARHVAYQAVSRDSTATRLQADAANTQTRVLELQRELSATTAETSRLYVTMLVLVLLSVGFWAYDRRPRIHFAR
jgi:hypothetical protein